MKGEALNEAGETWDDPCDGECNGLGYIECFCGGDLCVCDNYGEIPCGGCDACELADEFEDDYE